MKRARAIAAFAAGVVFAVGLGLSGMTRPEKVLGFLDFTGKWDPSLACVMGGALAVTLFAFRSILRRARPLFAARFHLPSPRAIDASIVVGAAIFGVGWGITGLCPGPAIVALATGAPAALLFVAAMAVGAKLASRVAPRADVSTAMTDD